MASLLEVEAMLLQRMAYAVETMVAELDPTLPAVLTAHGTIDGATTGVERQIMLGKDLVLPRSMLRPQLDYVAMGHIHKHQVLGHNPDLVYAGSIERIDFGEEHEAKGCVLVELEKGATRWRFHQLAARPFITIAVDVRGTSDPQGRVTTAIARHTLQQAVVRVQIEAQPEQASQLRTLNIGRMLEEAGAFAIAAVTIDVERGSRSRLGQAQRELLDGLTPRRALELYLRQKQTPEPRIAALLEAAEELFAEQGLS